MPDPWFGDRELVEEGIEVLITDPESGRTGGQDIVSYTVTGMTG